MRAVMLAVLATLAAPGLAHANCAADVERLAERVGVSTDLPQGSTPPGRTGSAAPEARGGVAPDALARSGGVIAPPPEQGRGRVIEPPAAAAPSMPTAPQIRPAPQEGEISSNAAKAAQVESLLTAARTAAERGDETECSRRVEEARALGDPG